MRNKNLITLGLSLSMLVWAGCGGSKNDAVPTGNPPVGGINNPICYPGTGYYGNSTGCMNVPGNGTYTSGNAYCINNKCYLNAPSGIYYLPPARLGPNLVSPTGYTSTNSTVATGNVIEFSGTITYGVISGLFNSETRISTNGTGEVPEDGTTPGLYGVITNTSNSPLGAPFLLKPGMPHSVTSAENGGVLHLGFNYRLDRTHLSWGPNFYNASLTVTR